jgi:hypothetical protein
MVPSGECGLKPSGVRRVARTSTAGPALPGVSRAITTAKDLIGCAPLFAADVLFAEMPLVEAGLLGITIAQCVPNLIGDAIAPSEANEALHKGTDLLTPWGFAAGLTALAMGGTADAMFSTATSANTVVDLANFTAGVSSKEFSEVLLEGAVLATSTSLGSEEQLQSLYEMYESVFSDADLSSESQTESNGGQDDGSDDAIGDEEPDPRDEPFAIIVAM